MTASMLILGSKGAAQVAAAGALLTATRAVGALYFVIWSFMDRLRARRHFAGPVNIVESRCGIIGDP